MVIKLTCHAKRFTAHSRLGVNVRSRCSCKSGRKAAITSWSRYRTAARSFFIARRVCCLPRQNLTKAAFDWSNWPQLWSP